MTKGRTDDPPDDAESWDEWVAVVGDLLDTAMDREEVIECVCEDLRVDVPLRAGPKTERARWHVDGTLKIHVEGQRPALSDWLRWWSHRLPSGSGSSPDTEG